MPRDGVQIHLNAAVQNGGCISRRVVADEAIRLQSPEAIARRLVLHGSAVDGDPAADLKPQLHAGRVLAECTGFDGFHIEENK